MSVLNGQLPVMAVHFVALWGFGVVVVAEAQGPAPGAASGSVSVDGKSVSLKYAYAMAQPNSFDEKKTDTAILLTERPLPDGALKGLKSLAWVNSEGTSLWFTLDETGRGTWEKLQYPSVEGSLQASGLTVSAFKPASHTKDAISGTIATAGVETFMKYKYQVNVSFSAAIVQAKRDEPLPDATTGEKLAPGGGEPGKAFLAFHAAIQKKDIAGIKLYAADVPGGTAEEMKEAVEMMAEMSPTDLKIVEGFVQGDLAVLYVTGVQDGQKQYGTIRMIKVGGAWKSGEERWKDKPRTN